jgi:DnaK suppressor protein
MEQKQRQELRTQLHNTVQDLEQSYQNKKHDLSQLDSKASDAGDEATINETFEMLNHDMNRLQAQIRTYRKAILRIDNDDDYGDCEGCDISIPLARLKALPQSSHCADCKSILEQKERMYA